MKQIKKLTSDEWKAIKPKKKDRSNYLIVPWSILKKDSEFIKDLTDFRGTKFTDFKAFILLQHYVHNNLITLDNVTDSITFSVKELCVESTLQVPRRVRETNLTVTIKGMYQSAVYADRYIRIPISAFEKVTGRDGLIVEALLHSYEIHTFDLLWRVIVDKYGTDEFRQDNIKRYWDRSKG